jgi:hypothetical protein
LTLSRFRAPLHQSYAMQYWKTQYGVRVAGQVLPGVDNEIQSLRIYLAIIELLFGDG